MFLLVRPGWLEHPTYGFVMLAKGCSETFIQYHGYRFIHIMPSSYVIFCDIDCVLVIPLIDTYLDTYMDAKTRRVFGKQE